MYYLTVIWIAKLVRFLSRLLHSGEGSTLPGLMAERLAPRLLENMGRSINHKVILVTGTNGKTTTVKILATIYQKAGYQVVTNELGSNFSRGILGAFITKTNWRGNLQGEVAILEVDEAYVRRVAKMLQPATIAVLNVLRDQLDRFGEIDRTAELIGLSLSYAKSVILNGDDPIVSTLASYVDKQRTYYFGAVPRLRRQLPHDAALHKRINEEKDESGKFYRILLTKIQQFDSHQSLTLLLRNKKYTVDVSLPGLYNAYNAAAALSIASLSLPADIILDGLAEAQPAFGRGETVTLNEKQATILLVKNPAGFNQIITTFLKRHYKIPQPLLIGINDHYADGRDVSWLWDVNFELIAGYNGFVIVTGTRAYDMALRLKYVDIESLVEQDEKKALDLFLEKIEEGGHGYIIPTYTPMLTLRKSLNIKAGTSKTWH